MKATIAMLALGFLVGLGPAIVIGDAISSERKAERQVCMEIAMDVTAGAVTRSAYMGTRCSARLLIQGNDNDAHD